MVMLYPCISLLHMYPIKGIESPTPRPATLVMLEAYPIKGIERVDAIQGYIEAIGIP